MSIFIKNRAIPIRCKYPELEAHIPKILEFKPFQNWQSRQNQAQTIREILIQDVDYFGDRIGFLKFKVDMRWEDGTPLPGIVFSRGDSVAVFLVIDCGTQEFVVLVQQPRVPVGDYQFLELPAGMIDDSESFVGVAAQELKEECGLEIKEQDLTFLSRVAPSPGACDEFVSIYKARMKMSLDEALSLEDRLGGLHEHGERIRLKLVKMEELYSTQSMTVLAGLCLYETDSHKNNNRN